MDQIGDLPPLKITDLLLYTVDDRLKTVHWILESKKCETGSEISRSVTSFSQAGEKLVKV
jgi:hypothetical protein